MPRTRPRTVRLSRQEDDLENLEVAQLIHEARLQAGLTQAELAERIGTRQQAIARLEDPGYDGHSVRVLNRIAWALGLKLSIFFAAAENFDG